MLRTSEPCSLCQVDPFCLKASSASVCLRLDLTGGKAQAGDALGRVWRFVKIVSRDGLTLSPAKPGGLGSAGLPLRSPAQLLGISCAEFLWNLGDWQRSGSQI